MPEIVKPDTDVFAILEKASSSLDSSAWIMSPKLDLVNFLLDHVDYNIFQLSQLSTLTAIEIGDARVDTGYRTEAQKLQPAFDPGAMLDFQQVIYIMDRLFECEMTWHDGQDLSQTVFTCLYIIHLDQIHPSRFPHRSDPLRPLVCLVLRAYILATLKGCDIANEEFRRGHLVEAEDFSTETNSISLLEETEIDDILDELDKAYKWLDALPENEEPIWIQAILERLRCRMSYFIGLCILVVSPIDHPLDAAALHLEQCAEAHQHFALFPCPGEATADQVRHLGIFDSNIVRSLPSQHPPRPMKVFNQSEASTMLLNIIDGLQSILKMLELRKWTELHFYFHFIGKQEWPALVRSLRLTMVFNENLVLRKHSLAWLTSSFLLDVGNVKLEQEMDKSRVDDPIYFFVTKLGGQLYNYFFLLSQNQSRRRRKLNLSIQNWQDLSREVGRATRDRPESFAKGIASALMFLQCDILLEATLSGILLELYTQDEMASVFYASECLLDVLLGSLQPLQTNARIQECQLYYKAKFLFSRMMCLDAMQGQITLSEAKEAARFRRRFKAVPLTTVPNLSWEKWRMVCNAPSYDQQSNQNDTREILNLISKLLKSPNMMAFDAKLDFRITKVLNRWQAVCHKALSLSELDVRRERVFQHSILSIS